MIVGLATYSVEDFRNLIEEERKKERPSQTDFEFMTVAEFQASDFSKDTKIILVDNIAKLLSIRDLKILDMEYFQGVWKNRKSEFKSKIWYLLSLEETWLKKVEYQFNIVPDFELGEYSFITHLNEFNKSHTGFIKKVHNILSKTQKETIDCSAYYKQLLKEKVINRNMSDLYLEFLNKKKQDYPILFKYMKFILESDYAEKDRKEAEKKEKKGE